MCSLYFYQCVIEKSTSSASFSCQLLIFITVLGNGKIVGPRLSGRVWESEALQLLAVPPLNRLGLQNHFQGCSDLCLNLNYKDIFFYLNCVQYSLALLPNRFCPLISILININILLENCHLLGC